MTEPTRIKGMWDYYSRARWPGIEFELPRADEISEESRAWGEERMRQYRELMGRLGLRQPEPILPDLPRG